MNWPMVKLKECCTVVGGATPKRNVDEYWDSRDVPWVTPKDVSSLAGPVLEDAPEYISRKGFEHCATYLLPKGSILLTSRAPIGNVAIAGRDLCTNQGFKSLVPSAEVDGTYLYYCVKAFSSRLQSLGNGATFKEVSKKIVEDFEIPLPPLAEQKRIATILDKADAIRRKRQQAIQLADEFIRAEFLDMFGDPVTNPKGWEFRNIGEFASIKNGYAFKSEYFSGEGDYVLLTPGNFYEKGGYRDRGDKQKFYSGPVADAFVLKAGDVLLAMTEQAEGLLGSSLVVPSDKIFLHNQRLGLVKYDENKVNRTFLAFLFNMASVRKLIHSSATGLKVRHTSPKKIEEIQVGFPDYYLQTRFSEIVTKIELAISNMNLGEDSSINLFQALTQRAFSGQL